MMTKEEVREYSRLYRLAFPEYATQVARRYQQRHPERVLASQRKSDAKRRVGRLAAIKQFRIDFPELARQRDREKWKNNIEGCRANCRAWRLRNIEYVRARLKTYNKLNPHKPRQYSQKRKALKQSVTASDCTVRIKYLKTVKECVYCKRVSDRPMQIDHVIPLSRGGPHEPSNLVAACINCNSRKGSKLLHEWKPNEWMKEAA